MGERVSGSFKFGMAPFYFLRHGETPESRNRVLQGQTDTALTRKGRQTAEQAALALAGVSLRSIYASPLKRAWHTAKIVSTLTRAPMYPLPGLMERNWGRYEGRPKKERPAMTDPPGAETMAAFSDRILEAMGSISGPLPVLVVAHSGVFRVLARHAGVPMDHRSIGIGNAHTVLFGAPRPEAKGWRISEISG